MRKMIYPAATALVLLLAAFTWFSVQQWQIDNNYSIKFTGKYADGTFKTMKGTIIFDEQNPAAAKFDVTIDVASINTGNGLKNRHARSDKWFDAEKYPVIHFVSSSVVKTAGGYEVKGILEMHGISKPFTIPFTFSRNGANGVFTGNFKVNRADYGITTARGDESDFTSLAVTVPVTSR
ncbi:YceI family protein [Chitinophaga solisilvae]|uniref:YceI family protein n=1 Tax=Chitinophaga solisilvae TaxID=1233460 RepID=UPI00136AD8F5|nr:YceI family protein [Chitinophaga solisilvae]